MSEPLSIGIVKDRDEAKAYFKPETSFYTFYTVEDVYLSLTTDTDNDPIFGSVSLYNPAKSSKAKPLNSTKHIAPEKQWGNAPTTNVTANATVPTMVSNQLGQRSWAYSPTAFCVSYSPSNIFNWGGKAHSILTTRTPNEFPVSWGTRPAMYTQTALPATTAKASYNIETVVPKLPTPRWWRRCGVQRVVSENFGSRLFYVLTDSLSRFYVYPVGIPLSDIVDGVTSDREYYAPDAYVQSWDFPFSAHGLEVPSADTAYALNSKLYKSSTFKANARPVFVWGNSPVDGDSAKSNPTTYDDWAGYESGFSLSKPLNSAHYVWSFNYNSTRATTIAYKLKTDQRVMQGILGDDYPMWRHKDCPYGYAIPTVLKDKVNASVASAMAVEGVNFSKDNRTLIPCKDSVTALLEVGIDIVLTGDTIGDFVATFSVLKADLSTTSGNYYVASGYSRPKWSDNWQKIVNGNGLAWSTLKLSGDTTDLAGYRLTDTVFTNNTETNLDFSARASVSTTKKDFYEYIRLFFSEGRSDLDEFYTELVKVLPTLEVKSSTVSGDFWSCKPADVSSNKTGFTTATWGPMLKVPIGTMITDYEIYAGDRLVDPGEVTFVSMHSLAWHLLNDPALLKFISAQIAVNLSRSDYVEDSHDEDELAYYFGAYYYPGVTIDGELLYIPTATNPDTSATLEHYPEALYAFQGYLLEALYFVNSSKSALFTEAYDGPLSHFYWHNYDIIFRLMQLALVNKLLIYSELEDVIRTKFMQVYFQFMFTGSTSPLEIKLEFPHPPDPPPPAETDYRTLYFDNLYEDWSISTIDGYMVSNIDTMRVRLPLNAAASNTLDINVLPEDRTKRFMATLVTFPSADAELVYAQTQAMESFGRKVYDFKAFLCGYETYTEYDDTTGLPTGNTPVRDMYVYKLVDTEYVVSRTSLDILGNFPELKQEDLPSYGKPLNLPPNINAAPLDMECAEFLKSDALNYTRLAFRNIQSSGEGTKPCETYWSVTTGVDFHIKVTKDTVTNVVAAHDFSNSDTMIYACSANENFHSFSLGSAQLRATEVVELNGGVLESDILTPSASGTTLDISEYALLYNWVHANFFGSDYYIPKTWLHSSPYATDGSAATEAALTYGDIPTREYLNRGYSMGPETPKGVYSFVTSDAYGSAAGYSLPPKGTLQVISAAIPTTGKRKNAISSKYSSAQTLDFVFSRRRKGDATFYYKTTHNDLFNGAFALALSEPRKYLYYCDTTSSGVGGGFATAGGFYPFKLPNVGTESCPNLKKEW